MTEALDLLDRQPDGWPRWLPGCRPNATLTDDQHLFLYVLLRKDVEATWFEIRPACHFVDGAEFVANATMDEADVSLPLCHKCFEVELQHGIA